MSTPPTPAAFFSNEGLKKCGLSKAECEAFKKNATFVGVYSHEDGRILVDSENDLRTQLTEIHKVLSDLWAHVVDMGWMDAEDIETMKSMSQVARVEDCPETLEEARVLLAQQSASIKAQWQRDKEISAQLAAVTKERDMLKDELAKAGKMLATDAEQLTAALARAEKAEEALRALKAVCCEVLLPSINEAVEAGFKMDTWTPEQFQFAKAVELTEAALTPTKEPAP